MVELLGRQLEHEVRGEALFVAPNLLHEHTGFNAIEISKVLVEDYLTAPDDQDPLLDRRRRNDLQLCFLPCRVGHVPMMANRPELIVYIGEQDLNLRPLGPQPVDATARCFRPRPFRPHVPEQRLAGLIGHDASASFRSVQVWVHRRTAIDRWAPRPIPLTERGTRSRSITREMCPASLHDRELLEMALRPLGALGAAAEFPQDQTGIEALIGQLAEGRPSEPKRFAYEGPDELPRYDGEWTNWLSPAGDGALRVRQEHPWELSSEAVVLHPDGRIGEFESIDGFGVPDSELTDQAVADREAHRLREREAADREPEHEEWLDRQQTRFRTGNLIRAVAAPPGQGSTGPVVAYVALYETGLMVNYLVPRPCQEKLEPDDPFAEPLMAAMFPKLEIEDGLGTAFKAVDIDYVDASSSPLRARVSFTPAVPAAARSLRISFETTAVEIELGSP